VETATYLPSTVINRLLPPPRGSSRSPRGAKSPDQSPYLVMGHSGKPRLPRVGACLRHSPCVGFASDTSVGSSGRQNKQFSHLTSISGGGSGTIVAVAKGSISGVAAASSASGFFQGGHLTYLPPILINRSCLLPDLVDDSGASDQVCHPAFGAVRRFIGTTACPNLYGCPVTFDLQ